MTVRILRGDCREILRTLPDESVHCVITSPPYFGLRDYGVAGQIGLERSPAEYLETMVGVFREVQRVLRADGTAWVNMGDSYATGTTSDRKPTAQGKHGYWENPAINKRIDGRAYGLKPKDLIGLPWMLAFALRADGWYLRQDIIWSKPNPMPESVTDRCTKSHEYIFLFSKSERYFYDFDAVKEPSSDNTHARLSIKSYVRKLEAAPAMPGTTIHNGLKGHSGRKLARHGSGTKNNESYDEAMSVMPDTRNKRSVWTIPTQAFPEAHFATFPPALIEPCIKAGTSERGCCSKCFAPMRRLRGRECEQCHAFIAFQAKECSECGFRNTEWREQRTVSEAHRADDFSQPGLRVPRRQDLTSKHVEGGWELGCECDAPMVPCTVLDPFGGAGTTGLVADRHGRDAILIELNPSYVGMAERRIRQDAPLFAEVQT